MKYLLLIVCTTIAFKSIAQTTTTSVNEVGINHTIQSSVLEEERTLQVHLPDDYQNSNKNYPVIYLLDGQRFFLYGVSLYQSFHEFDLTPDFIVVGITNDQSKRMRTFSTGGDDFLNYLQKEVIPFIDNTYRTSEKRLLFGWAYGGGFALEAMMKNSNLFDGFILSSPYPVEIKIDRFRMFLTENKDISTFLYYSSYKEENGVREGTSALTKLINEENSKLRWHFKDLKGETHRSTPYTTLYHGVLSYFDFYQNLHFSTLEEFNELGGLNYFNEYYQKRHKLYGKDLEPAAFPKYAILRLAISAKEFETFKKLYKELGGDELIKQLRASWACLLADYYLSNNYNKEAENIFQIILENNPEYERALEGLNKSTSD